MTYPISIQDEYELTTLIKIVSKETVRQELLQTGQIKPMMKLVECYRMLSRRKVDGAIKANKLKCVKKGANILIRRDDFESFIGKHDFET